jgi:hypothetical protein
MVSELVDLRVELLIIALHESVEGSRLPMSPKYLRDEGASQQLPGGADSRASPTANARVAKSARAR